MWEFSLNLKAENSDLAYKLFNAIKKISVGMGGVSACHEENGYISILIAVKKRFVEEMQFALSSVITHIICTNFKSAFLEKFLFLPEHDKTSMTAFKKALINFDKETDKFLVQKELVFENSLFLESFYQFKLSTLRAKWTELVSLANENRVYLISDDAFFDLLKFLVDNLDVCEEEVNVFEDEEGFKIELENSDNEYQNKVFNEEGLVSSIIDLSPQKINFYCNKGSSTCDFLEKIFENRINVCMKQNISNCVKKL